MRLALTKVLLTVLVGSTAISTPNGPSKLFETMQELDSQLFEAANRCVSTHLATQGRPLEADARRQLWTHVGSGQTALLLLLQLSQSSIAHGQSS
jgi:hypothetical protein